MSRIEKFVSERISWPYGLRGVLCVFLILVPFFCFELNIRPFCDPDEGRYVEISREMVATGDYITPRLNGLKYFEKPPLFYWLQSALIRAFGIDEFSMRILPALFAILGCLGLFCIARRRYSNTVALISSSILATNLLYYGMGHIITLDLVTSVLICGVLWCFYAAFVAQDFFKHKQILIVFMYIFAALAFMTKGLIGIVLPGLVVIIWAAISKNLKRIPEFISWPGIICFLVIVVPWHMMMAMRHEDFLYKYFFIEHFVRYTTTFHSRYQPMWFFIPVALTGLLPWTGFAISAIKNEIIDAKKNHSESIFLLSWIFSIFIFYSFSNSKLIPYILPIWPPIAMIVGKWVTATCDINNSDFKIAALTNIVITLLGSMAFFIHRPHMEALLKSSDFSICLYTIIALLIIECVVRGFAVFVRKARFASILVSIVIAMNVCWTLNKAAFFYQEIKRPSTKDMAELIRLNKREGDLVFAYKHYYQDMPVYLNSTINLVDYIGELEFGYNAVDEFQKKCEIKSTTQFWNFWKISEKRIFLLLSVKQYGEVFAMKDITHRLLGINKNFVVITNK